MGNEVVGKEGKSRWGGKKEGSVDVNKEVEGGADWKIRSCGNRTWSLGSTAIQMKCVLDF